MDGIRTMPRYDAVQCMETLKETAIYSQLLHDLENDCIAANIKENDKEHDIKLKAREYLSSNNKLLSLKNAICKILITSCSPNERIESAESLEWKAPIPDIASPEEPLEVVANARNEWDQRLRYQLRTLSVQQKRPLVQMQASPDSSSSSSSDVLSLRYIYTCEDLLETVANIVNPNSESSSMQQSMRWGLIKLDLNTPNLQELRLKFKELHPRFKHLGVDDRINGSTQFVRERLKKGERYLKSPYIPQLREYGKFGIPSGLRSKMWDAMMVAEEEQNEEQYFNDLLDAVDDIDSITDCLYRLDVDQTVDHEDFFPFDDFLNDILLAFSRDPKISTMAAITLNTAVLSAKEEKPEAAEAGTATVGKSQAVPPCHVIPFHQQTLLCCPLCFLHSDPQNAYFLFRKLFCKFLCRLHIISSQPATILSLCKLFESLTSYLYPSLFFHCVNKIGVQPLTVVFPWIFTAFASYLQNEEVLSIWDRIISFHDDGLLLLPIICCAIFGFRKEDLLKCETPESLHGVLKDLRTIKVIPLLQHFLFTARQN